MYKEIGVGLGLALLLFLMLTGHAVTPLLFAMGLCAGVFYLARTRGFLSNQFGTAAQSVRADISFADIGGQSTAIRELREALDFIRHHSRASQMGIRPIKGILLTGPPGTGKTLLAKAAAAYTDAVFSAASGSEFIEMYAGVGAQRVRRLFQSAKEQAVKTGKKNALVFIDEIEILGGKRGQITSHLEYDQTLNQLLVEMDGIKTCDQVHILLVGATNRADMLDPALLRPGRFDRQVKVDIPDKKGRLEILLLHTKNKPLAIGVQLEQIAQETFGFSGAHLESLANEAAILALRENLSEIHQRHLMEAVDKVIMGERLDRRPTDEEMRRIAIHESGHALISELLKPGSVSAVTVTSRGNALGYMRVAASDDAYIYTREQLEVQIAVTLGGALAEELVLGSRSTGAGGDIEQALQAARTIIDSGMSELGVISSDTLPRKLHYETNAKIIEKQEERVKSLLNSYGEILTKAAAILLEEEKISGERFRELMTCS